MILKGEWQDNNNFGAAMNPAIIELSQTNNTWTTTDGVTISFSTSTGKLVGTNLSSTNSAQFVGTIEFIPSNASSASTMAMQTADGVQFGTTTVGAHLNQTATKNIAGTCGMSSATTCTFVLNAAFNTTPICIATSQTAGTIAAGCSVSGTTVTIYAASSSTGTWGALVIGNPN